jgi:hypothetical protein
MAHDGHYGGGRSTKTEVLRHIALKKKMEENPMLGRGIKITKKMALVMSEDPHVNDF